MLNAWRPGIIWSQQELGSKSLNGCQRWAVTRDIQTLSNTGRSSHESVRCPQAADTEEKQRNTCYITITRPQIHTHYLINPSVFVVFLASHMRITLLFSSVALTFTQIISCIWQHSLTHSYALITLCSNSAQTKINSLHSQRWRPSGKSVEALFTWINSFWRPYAGKLDYINNPFNLD